MKDQTEIKALENIEEIKRAIELLAELPDNLDFSVDLSIQRETVHVTIPFDLDCFRQYRKAMGKNWETSNMRLSHTDFDNHVAKSRRYQHNNHPGTDVLLALDTKLNASTCHIVQVGEETKPIYEVVCK